MSAWSVPISALAERAKEDLATTVRRVTLILFRRVVLGSPVDTGRFRANWNAAFGTPDYSVTLQTDQQRGMREAEKASGFPAGGVAYLSNGLPYGLRLEHGWSKQAPSGMVKLAAASFARAVQEAARS